MSLLVAGVLIAGWTLKVTADSYSVTGKVAAPPLTDGAFITSPADGAVFTTSPITVSGTCPDNSYVILTRNGSFSGSASCVNTAFSIVTSLSPGTNVLNAQDYNITDDAGPATPNIAVTYLPPSPPPTPTGISSSPTVVNTPSGVLSLTSEYHYQGFVVGSAFSWELEVHGGTAPYTLRIDWGDAQVTTQSIASAGAVTITHQYTRPGYFPVIITATDANGATALLQIAAFMRLPGVSGYLIQNQPGTPSFWQNLLAILGDSKWLTLAWPSYITVVLMAASFWLGEQRAVQLAVQRQAVRRQLHHR